MSGQQIGTVIGGAIGAYFGGPAGAQLGMAIGGLIGGAVDPTHINGPKIGDGQQQTATDGAPIAWVQGTALIAGTIVQVSKRRQIRHKDSGKGGPVVTTFTAEQDFAILVCESCELRDSTMSSVLMVLQDGKLVYDVRPGSTMLSDSAKWKSNVDFMFGAEDQLPHPTLEAITGVGNTPAYRGSLVAVFKNFDVSQAGDRIPTFQFVVASSGIPARFISYDSYPGWSCLPELNGAYHTVDASDPSGYSSPSFDDSNWIIRRGALGYRQYGADNYGRTWTTSTIFAFVNDLDRVWLRKHIEGQGTAITLTFVWVGAYYLWWNGVLLSFQDGTSTPSHGTVTIPAASVLAHNVLVVKNVFVDTYGGLALFGADIAIAPVDRTPTSLSQIVGSVCKRGGLTAMDYDVADFANTFVEGYPIARQANAADCLLPLMQAYFGYASEYDAQLHFKFYGADASVVIDRADLIEGNDASKGAIVSNLRNQSTEFPRRIVGSYTDPAQNYTVVNVAAERRAVDVIAIGDQSFQIPVVMSADDAAKAVDKALKVAYATLEGKLEYSTPFAGADVYLSLAAGEALQLLGKRYVADELILSNGSIKLTTRYDRQSAYTSSVQAILGNAPVPPASPYSGPTTLYVMNLPAQRPQDTVGVYLVAAGSLGQASWAGCTVQVSYDGLATWQNALQIRTEGTLGTVALAEPTGGEPLTVDVLKYDLENATPAQLTAMANVFAIVSATGLAQLGQFSTATETTPDKRYELTGVARPLGGTTSSPIAAGNTFALMDAAYFLPIDLAFAGRVLYFRAVGFGEVAEDADVVSLVYTALLPNEGSQIITEDGAFDFVTESGLLTFRSE